MTDPDDLETWKSVAMTNAEEVERLRTELVAVESARDTAWAEVDVLRAELAGGTRSLEPRTILDRVRDTLTGDLRGENYRGVLQAILDEEGPIALVEAVLAGAEPTPQDDPA